jgi:photosystem II stability/assembly factor-like uncharacterized protein
MRVSGGIAAALCATAMLSADGAAANGRYPASTQIVFSTDAADPDRIVVRTTYGLLISRDSGATWRWLCEGALGVPGVSVEDPSIALSANDALVVGLDEGLEVSRDGLGCNFDCIGGPVAEQSIVDLAAVPGAPHSVLALGSTLVFDDGGAVPLHDTRVWQTSDDGAHWSQRGSSLDPTVAVTTLDVAASDPERLYVSGTRGFGGTRTASLFVSTDGGESWTERPLPFDPATEVSVFIGAVDPGNADRVYVRTSGLSRLLVSGDAGRSFQIPLTLTGQMLGFAITSDGAKVYAGSVEDGLLVATAPDPADAGSANGGFAFRKVSSIHVQCLATRGRELWACSDQAGGFSVGVSTNDGAQFASRLQPSGLPDPIACAPSTGGPFACGATANASQCGGAAFEATCIAVGGCSEDASAVSNGGREGDPSGGAPSLTPDAAVQAIRAPAASCGCSLVADTSSEASEVGAVCLIVTVAARRRRRRSD